MSDTILRSGTILTMQGLARAVDTNAGGSRRADGRPTSPRTCERWCLHGRQGIVLPSWTLVSVRVTTWGYFLDWCKQLEQAKAQKRRRCLEAVQQPRRGRGAAKKAEEARRRLEEMGAR